MIWIYTIYLVTPALSRDVLPYCTQKGQNCIQFWPFVSAIELSLAKWLAAQILVRLLLQKLSDLDLQCKFSHPALSLLHSERPKLHTILAFLNAIRISLAKWQAVQILVRLFLQKKSDLDLQCTFSDVVIYIWLLTKL